MILAYFSNYTYVAYLQVYNFVRVYVGVHMNKLLYTLFVSYNIQFFFWNIETMNTSRSNIYFGFERLGYFQGLALLIRIT